MKVRLDKTGPAFIPNDCPKGANDSQTLQKWDEVLDDEDLTRNTTSIGGETEDDMCSVISEVSSSSILMQDPKFVRLQQKPRCLLCSKFFADNDIVTESWEPSCTHNFHKECMVSWLQKKNGCPICKKAYVVGLVVEDP